MTIASTVRTAGPFTSGSSFAFAFKVFAQGDVAVYRTLVSTGVVTTLALTTDYTVALNADQDGNPGGTVTLNTALVAGQSLLIVSAVANTQSTDITNQSGFYPEVINDALDRATVQVQQVQVQANLGLRFPATEISLNAELPKASDRANQYLAFNSNGEVDIGGAVPDQRYYGSKTADPATRNDGSARSAGDLYYNSVTNTMKVFNGSAWDTVTTTPVDGDKGDITLSGGASTYTIDNDAVTTAKILNANVTAAKLATNSVETAKIVDLNVTTGKIAAGAVTSAKLDTNIDIAGTLDVTGVGTFDTNISVAGDVIVANTKGIDFSATANGSGTPTTEKLVDYEEGAWAPVFAPASGAFTTMTMDVPVALYTKVGNVVTLVATIRTDNVSIGTATGNLYITGLPYPIASTNVGGGAVYRAEFWSTNHPHSVLTNFAEQALNVLYRNTAGNSATANLPVSSLTTGATADRNLMQFTATYWTA